MIPLWLAEGLLGGGAAGLLTAYMVTPFIAVDLLGRTAPNHVRPLLRQRGHQPAVAELADCSPRCRGGHPVLLAEGSLGRQPGAERDLAGLDAGGDVVGDLDEDVAGWRHLVHVSNIDVR